MVQMLYHLIKLVKKIKGAKINKLKFAGRIIIKEEWLNYQQFENLFDILVKMAKLSEGLRQLYGLGKLLQIM